MKKIGIILTILGIIVFPIVSYDLFADKKVAVEFTVPVMILSLSFIFLGPAFSLFPLSIEKLKKISKRSFVFSISLITFGVISKFMRWPGAGIEFIIGVLIFSLFYGTLSLKIKYEKWKVYARSNFDALFLSLFDFVGIGSLFLGFLFKLQHWPMAQQLIIVGIIVLAVGVLAWNQKFKKEVVFRKETEDKLKESLEQIELQHQKLEEKQKEIIDSINYAKRIQNSLMSNEKYINSHLMRLKK